MEKIKIKALAQKIFKIFKWAFLILAGLFIVLVIARIPHYFKVQKTEDQILKIHNTKLKMEDVQGKNLPSDPGVDADKTLQGIDANMNGIRDDVEIAIFKEYPNSAKTRAVLLQYAMTLQMIFTQPFVNEEIATEVITEQGRADTCLSDNLVPRKSPESAREYSDIEKINKFINFIEDKQINNKERENFYGDFYKYLRSYGESNNQICDVDLEVLSD